MILDTILLSLKSEIFFISTLLQRESEKPNITCTCDSILSTKLHLARAISDCTSESWTQVDFLGASHAAATLLF